MVYLDGQILLGHQPNTLTTAKVNHYVKVNARYYAGKEMRENPLVKDV